MTKTILKDFGMIKYIRDELKRRGLKRVGKCNKCGKCCIGDAMRFRIDRKQDVNDRNRNKICRLEYISPMKRDTESCPCFNSEINLCSIQDRKPQICEIFPAFPEHLKDVKEFCGFSFTKIKS